ncbi:MAG: GNAT family N-acetyltransferase [Jiangellaceae bacterium]
MTDDDLELRTGTVDDVRQHAELVAAAFLMDVDDEAIEARGLVRELDRIHVVTDEGHLVASSAILTRDMSVPGAVIPVAHVTGVAVAPTHRRRGLLSRLMAAQFDEIRQRGTEPVAALWASEGVIYGRFGYGLSSWHVPYEVKNAETTMTAAPPAGRIRQAAPRDVIDRLAEVYDRAQRLRPGISGRSKAWWEYLTTEMPSRRHGRTAERVAMYEVDGEVQGYASYRVKQDWGDTGPKGEVFVREVVVTSAESYAALWRFLLSIDLTRSVTYEFASADEPLPHLLTNPNAIRTSVEPALWIRLIDLPTALTARRYAVPVDVVLDVSDDMLPDNTGRWRLCADGEKATCEPSDYEPDLSLHVRELGAAYLGGMSLLSLAGAGRVAEHTPGSLQAASAAFGWHRAPLSFEIF